MKYEHEVASSTDLSLLLDNLDDGVMNGSNSTSTANGRTAATDFTNAYLRNAGLSDDNYSFRHLLLERYLDDDVPSEKQSERTSW